MGTDTGNLLFFLVVSEPVSEKFGTEKSPRTSIKKNLVPKKVLEPVSENFGTKKSIGTGLEKNLVPKKVPEPVSENFGTEKSLRISIVQILGLLTHWLHPNLHFVVP